MFYAIVQQIWSPWGCPVLYIWYCMNSILSLRFLRICCALLLQSYTYICLAVRALGTTMQEGVWLSAADRANAAEVHEGIHESPISFHEITTSVQVHPFLNIGFRGHLSHWPCRWKSNPWLRPNQGWTHFKKYTLIWQILIHMFRSKFLIILIILIISSTKSMKFKY